MVNLLVLLRTGEIIRKQLIYCVGKSSNALTIGDNRLALITYLACKQALHFAWRTKRVRRERTSKRVLAPPFACGSVHIAFLTIHQWIMKKLIAGYWEREKSRT